MEGTSSAVAEKEVLHDVQYDVSGKRMATCTADGKIKVWDYRKDDWVLSVEWKAHNGSIWKLSWAPEEYGQLLASCSYDNKVCIWEEPKETTGKQIDSWKLRSSFLDTKTSVQDVAFAPGHTGLRLASASRDGDLYVYKSADLNDLTKWEKTSLALGGKGNGCSCLSWNSSKFQPLMVAVGMEDGRLKICKYSEEEVQDASCVVFYEFKAHEGSVQAVSWAPALGRNYFLIATAGQDAKVKIWKVAESDKKQYTHQTLMSSVEAGSVWKVDWNVTGTVLAAASDEGSVRLWRNSDGEWPCVHCIQREGATTRSVR